MTASLHQTAQPNLLEQLLEASVQGIWIIDADGITTAANPAMCRLLDRELSAVIGHSAFELLTPVDAMLLRSNLSQPDNEGRAADTVLERPDGSRRLCVRQLRLLRDLAGNNSGWLMTWDDVTVQRQAENVLEMFHLATNSTPDLLSVVDETGHYRMVNDAWCRANRLERKDVLGHHVRQVAPEQIIPERRQALVECMLRRRPVSVRDRVHIADRGAVDMEIDYYPFGDDLHQTRHVMMVCRDVSAREAVLRASQAAEADKRALLEAFPGYIAAIDQDLRYVYVNAATAARMGGRPEEVVGRSVNDLLEGDTLKTMLTNIRSRCANPGVPFIAERHFPARGDLPALSLQVTQVSTPVALDGSQTFYTFGIDVSDHLRAKRDMDLVLNHPVQQNEPA